MWLNIRSGRVGAPSLKENRPAITIHLGNFGIGVYTTTRSGPPSTRHQCVVAAPHRCTESSEPLRGQFWTERPWLYLSRPEFSKALKLGISLILNKLETLEQEQFMRLSGSDPCPAVVGVGTLHYNAIRPEQQGQYRQVRKEGEVDLHENRGASLP